MADDDMDDAEIESMSSNASNLSTRTPHAAKLLPPFTGERLSGLIFIRPVDKLKRSWLHISNGFMKRPSQVGLLR